MGRLITEYLGVLFGILIFGGYFFCLILSGNILKSCVGLIAIFSLGIFTFFLTNRLIRDCIAKYKDKKKGSQS